MKDILRRHVNTTTWLFGEGASGSIAALTTMKYNNITWLVAKCIDSLKNAPNKHIDGDRLFFFWYHARFQQYILLLRALCRTLPAPQLAGNILHPSPALLPHACSWQGYPPVLWHALCWPTTAPSPSNRTFHYCTFYTNVELNLANWFSVRDMRLFPSHFLWGSSKMAVFIFSNTPLYYN